MANLSYNILFLRIQPKINNSHSPNIQSTSALPIPFNKPQRCTIPHLPRARAENAKSSGITRRGSLILFSASVYYSGRLCISFLFREDFIELIVGHDDWYALWKFVDSGLFVLFSRGISIAGVYVWVEYDVGGWRLPSSCDGWFCDFFTSIVGTDNPWKM